MEDGIVEPLFEFSTGKVIKDLTRKARIKTGNPDVHVIGICAFEDSATQGKRGCRSSTPLSWTASIFCSTLRNSSSGKTLGLYIPKLPKPKKATKEDKRALIRWTKHLAIAFFVKLFDSYGSKPFAITFTSKTEPEKTRTVWFVVR